MRTINVEVNGEFIRKDSKNGGVQGEGNATTLHIVFDSTWDGYGKRVIFRDAQGENPVAVPLTKTVQQMVDDPANEYDAVIPSEALALPGWLSFTIDGYKEGETGTEPDTKEPGEIALTVRDFLKVYENDTAYKPSEPTPSQAQQIMSAVEKIVPDVKAAATEAKSWAVGGTGSREGEDTDNAKYYAQSSIDKANAAAQSAQEAAQSATSAEQSANAADASAKAAAFDADKANDGAIESESWAVGGTGTRPGEDTNNAKYWSEEARKTAGGGVSTFNGRSGVVMPQKDDYTADMVGARPDNWTPSASDVGAIPKTEKGAQNGVATLGADKKVPKEQLPEMNYLPLTGGTLTGPVNIQAPAEDNQPLRRIDGASTEMLAKYGLPAGSIPDAVFNAIADIVKPTSGNLPVIKTGTYTGNGQKTLTINLGFYFDLILIFQVKNIQNYFNGLMTIILYNGSVGNDDSAGLNSGVQTIYSVNSLRIVPLSQTYPTYVISKREKDVSLKAESSSLLYTNSQGTTYAYVAIGTNNPRA